jgi:hypothetical protein
MKIDVKVYGQIKKITKTEYAIQIEGSVDTVTLDSKYCDMQNTFFFQSPYHGIVIEGADLKVVKQKEDKVEVKGVVFTIKFLNENGETAKRYNVQTCCIKVEEVPEEEFDEEDLLDEGLLD